MAKQDIFKLLVLAQAIMAVLGYVDYRELVAFIIADCILWWSVFKPKR